MASNLNGEKAIGGSDVQFAYFLAKPMIAWSPVLSGMHAWMCQFQSTQVSLQQEWAGFVSRRLQQDAALPHKLSEVKAPEEAWHVYRDFVEQAMEDYRMEYATLARLGTGFASQAVNGAASQSQQPAPAAKAVTETQVRRSLEAADKVAALADG